MTEEITDPYAEMVEEGIQTYAYESARMATAAATIGIERGALRAEVTRLTVLAADLETALGAAREQVERLITEAGWTRPILYTGRAWRDARHRDVPTSVYLAALRAHVGAIDAQQAAFAEAGQSVAASPVAEEGAERG